MPSEKEFVSQCLSIAGFENGKLIDKISGAINDSYKLELPGGQKLALRVRSRHDQFRYEQAFQKEAIAAEFLASDLNESAERALDLAIGRAASSSLTFPIKSAILPSVLYCDHSKRIIPYIWSLAEWIDGPTLDKSCVPKNFAALADAVSELHSASFTKYRKSFDDPWSNIDEWSKKAVNEVRQSSVALGLDLDLREFDKLSVQSLVLAHNDLQPFNVIVQENCVRLIDWDNCQVAPKELDLVKLKYWTCIDNNGWLTADHSLYQSFFDRYCACANVSIDPDIFRLSEILWLCRIFGFEKSRESTGRAPIPPFRPAAYYRDEIVNWTKRESSR